MIVVGVRRHHHVSVSDRLLRCKACRDLSCLLIVSSVSDCGCLGLSPNHHHSRRVKLLHLGFLILLEALLQLIAQGVRADSESAHEVNRLRVVSAVLLVLVKGDHAVEIPVHLISNCLCLEEAFFEDFKSVSNDLHKVLFGHTVPSRNCPKDFKEESKLEPQRTSNPEENIADDFSDVERACTLDV